MKDINKLKRQISMLYVCAVTQVAVTVLGFVLFEELMQPRVLWATSLILNLIVVIFTRPFQLMDALIDGYSAQHVIKQLAEAKKRKKNDKDKH